MATSHCLGAVRKDKDYGFKLQDALIGSEIASILHLLYVDRLRRSGGRVRVQRYFAKVAESTGMAQRACGGNYADVLMCALSPDSHKALEATAPESIGEVERKLASLDVGALIAKLGICPENTSFEQRAVIERGLKILVYYDKTLGTNQPSLLSGGFCDSAREYRRFVARQKDRDNWHILLAGAVTAASVLYLNSATPTAPSAIDKALLVGVPAASFALGLGMKLQDHPRVRKLWEWGKDSVSKLARRMAGARAVSATSEGADARREQLLRLVAPLATAGRAAWEKALEWKALVDEHRARPYGAWLATATSTAILGTFTYKVLDPSGVLDGVIHLSRLARNAAEISAEAWLGGARKAIDLLSDDSALEGSVLGLLTGAWVGANLIQKSLRLREAAERAIRIPAVNVASELERGRGQVLQDFVCVKEIGQEVALQDGATGEWAQAPEGATTAPDRPSLLAYPSRALRGRRHAAPAQEPGGFEP
jgi:hypothetical protein